jgi:hypothetical protein
MYGKRFSENERERERAFLGALALGLRALSPAIASLRVAWHWQGAFGADRTMADLGYVCSVVAWPGPVRSCGCCWLDHKLYTMVLCCKKILRSISFNGQPTVEAQLPAL